jgi:plastocyanin
MHGRPRLRILRPMSTTPHTVARLAPAVILLALAGALAGVPRSAPAGELQVYVTTPNGRPAPDVVVSVVLPDGVAAPAVPVSAQPVLVVQKDIRFQPYVTGVPLGTTLRFINRDRFDHHVRSVAGGPLGSIAPAKDFEFRLAAARSGSEPSADLKMDAPGAIGIGCHLHGSMRAHVYVSPTPWVAVTDAAGRAVLPGVPDGAVDLRLWHPDQLVAQATVRAAVAGASSAQASLNFTPRRRPAPPPKGEYDD